MVSNLPGEPSYTNSIYDAKYGIEVINLNLPTNRNALVVALPIKNKTCIKSEV